MAGRGPKINKQKNYLANLEWKAGKKIGRPKQQWINGRWEKV